MEEKSMKDEEEVVRQEIGGPFGLSKLYASKGPSVYDYLLSDPTRDVQFTLSGRSALGQIIDDILIKKKVDKAYLPAYSCISMVLPFIRRKISVEFYEVDYKDDRLRVDIQLNPEYDIFFFMQYFGETTNRREYSKALSYCKEHDISVIENITHSLLGDRRFRYEPDYSFASLRKWFAIPSGGIAYKTGDFFAQEATFSSDVEVRMQLEAMQMKTQYLKGEIDEKEKFLRRMKDFEVSLADFDSDLTMDSFSLVFLKLRSIDEVKEQRKKNARYLFDQLRSVENIKFLMPFPNFDTETPLFVPLVIDKDKRDQLRDYLADHDVYLPVHWPRHFGLAVGLKDRELSLVCDQRYTPQDMEYMVSLIKNWNSQQRSR